MLYRSFGSSLTDCVSSPPPPRHPPPYMRVPNSTKTTTRGTNRQGARWFKKAKKLRSDMVGVADEFGKQLFNELDYVKEAYNCIRFKVKRAAFVKAKGHAPASGSNVTHAAFLVREVVYGHLFWGW